MNRKTKLFLASLTISTALLSGCAPSPYSGNVYSGSQANTAQRTSYGTVVSVRPVKIDGDRGTINTGTVVGAALGGIAGNAFGHGLGRVATTAGGAVVGGLAGNAIQNKATSADGQEIVVRLNDGSEITVAQGTDERFSVGQRVKVVGSGNNVRVTR